MVHHTSDTDQKKRSPVPDDLTAWDRWACHRKKRPVDPVMGRSIDWKDSGKWLSFEQATAAAGEHGHDGKGFVLSPDDPFTVFDFDGCGDRATGYLHPAVLEILDRLGNPYSEWSPSGKGIRTVVRATKPEGRCKTSETPWGDNFEMYDRARFFTVTGNVFNPGGVPDAQRAVDALHGRFLAQPPQTIPTGISEARKAVSGQHVGLTDDEVRRKARNHPKTGGLFRKLDDHDDASGYPSRSEADQAFCNMLAYWTGCDADQMKRIYRDSVRARGKYAEKVLEGQGEHYLDRTVTDAVETCTATYDPGYGERMKGKVRDAVSHHRDRLEHSPVKGNRRGVMHKMLDIAATRGVHRGGAVDFNANQTAIADDLGISQWAVSNHIKELLREGWMLRTRKGTTGRNSAYRLPKPVPSNTYADTAYPETSNTYDPPVGLRIRGAESGTPSEPSPEPETNPVDENVIFVPFVDSACEVFEPVGISVGEPGQTVKNLPPRRADGIHHHGPLCACFLCDEDAPEFVPASEAA